MVERDHGAGRHPADERDEAVKNQVGSGGGANQLASEAPTSDPREEERHRRVMASAERVMRKHRGVFAVLAR